MKTIKIKSWLPVFTGFYETLFSPETDIFEEFGENFEWENFNNSRYEQDVMLECCKVLQSWLPKESGVSKIEFERVVSPKEYNFTNDAADVTFTVDIEKFSEWFNAYLKKHKGKFEEYLKRYRSRDGFMSYYSSDIDDWVKVTNNFSDFTSNPAARYSMRDFGTHSFGALLNFYFLNEKDDAVLSLYYDVMGNVPASNYVIENQPAKTQ